MLNPETLTSHLEKMLNDHMIFLDNDPIDIFIWRSNVDERTPYCLEIIDKLMPDSNHFMLVEKSLDTLMRFIPLDLSQASIDTHKADCAFCSASVQDFLQKATTARK